MQKLIRLVFIIFCLLLLTACKPDDLRAMASNSITITFDGKTCLPLESFIPQGDKVDLKLINLSDNDFSWFFIILPVKGTFDPNNLENIYFSESVSALDTIETSFTAPMMPARYDTLCMPAGDPSRIVLKYVLVVEPYPPGPN